MTEANRQEWIDDWRGVLIVLVVLGHAAGGAFHLQPEGATRDAFALAYNVIYAFHMPAFFFLSGCLWPSYPIDVRSFLKKRFLRLMVPYFVFGVLSILLYHLALGGFTAAKADVADGYYASKGIGGVWSSVCGLLSMGAWPENEAYRYNSVLWFLPCMFLTQTVFLFLTRLLDSVRTRWSVGVGLLALTVVTRVQLQGSYPMALNRLPQFLLMMELGWAFARFWKHDGLFNRMQMGIVVSALTIGFAFLRMLLPDTNVSYGSFLWALAFVLLAIVGTVVSWGLSRVIGSRALRFAGRSAITIMLLHKFLVVGLELGHPVVRNVLKTPSWVSVAYVVMLTLASVAFCCFVDRAIRRFAPWCIGARGY